MDREILRIAIPNIISNITVPLMGIASTAIAGHIDSESSVEAIGALAIGASIFNFIYWNCGFVRMGTSGLTAQAFGRGDWKETTRMLYRALAVSLVMGLLVLILQYPLGELSLWVMNGNEAVRDYYYARIWAVPAGILLFGMNGWYTGMQNAVVPMIIAIVVNLTHIIASLIFVFHFGMGIVGIAYASVLAQGCGVLLSFISLWLLYRKKLQRVEFREVFDWEPMRRFFLINRDIILRTLCIVAVYTSFTAISARMDEGILAVNTLLLQLFTLFSYMNDGFAYAAEALTGRFIGARDVLSLKRCLGRCIAWGTAISAIFVVIYIIWWRDLLGMFISEGADSSHIIEIAGRYIIWIIITPIAAATPFIMDGIMVGATETRVMRNSMFGATVIYFITYLSLNSLIGNNALWLAFMLYMLLRGVLQYFMTNRLQQIYSKAE